LTQWKTDKKSFKVIYNLPKQLTKIYYYCLSFKAMNLDKKQYSISDLEQLSGVSAHNIRIWERRYNALQPSRTAGNTRFYNDDQLSKLLNISALYYSGHKISKACAMGKDETASFLQQEIDSSITRKDKYEYYITQIINSGLNFNEHRINRLIDGSFEQNGVLETYKFVLYPVLVRMGLMWRKESLCPSQEHFISAIIKQKIFTAIDQVNTNEASTSSWLLFLPDDEDHDIGLLLASYILRSLAHKVIYLGSKVPVSSLANAIDSTKPANLLFFITRIRPVKNAQEYIDNLSSSFKEQQIYLSGNHLVLGDLNFPERVKWLKDINDLENILKLQN